MKIQLRGINFNVNNSFAPLFWEDLNHCNWETTTIDIIDEFVKEESCVLDIGCWAGPLSLYMAGKGANVQAIDPDPIAYKELMENLKLNPAISSKITPHNLAISSVNGVCNLHAREGLGNSSTSLLNRTRDRIKNIASTGLTLEEFIDRNGVERIDFLKIDIEGGEFAIANQLEDLKKNRRFNCLHLSLHFDHLNESIYQKKLPLKLLSLVLMKFERITGKHLFKKELLKQLKPIASLANEFSYVYLMDEKKISVNTITPVFLLKNKTDLFLSETPRLQP